MSATHRTRWWQPLVVAALVLAATLPIAAEELALIDDIVVAGERPEEPTADHLTVVVAATGTSQAGRRAMGLSAGDEVRTGPDVQVVLRFLDLDSDVDPLVFVDENASYQITGPTTLSGLFGRLFASVAGLFSVITPGGRLGVEGTEFEVVIGGDGAVEIQVLDGVVAFAPAELEAVATRAEPPADEPATARPDINIKLAAGTQRSVRMDIVLSNGCPTTESFFIESPAAIPWVRIDAASQPVAVPANGRAAAETWLRIDTTGVPAGIYRGEIVLRCEGCTTCAITRAAEPLVIEVTAPASEVASRPTAQVDARSREEERRRPSELHAAETARPTADSGAAEPLRIRALERASFAADAEVAAPEPMAEQEVARTLDWTDDVFVAVQPSYAAEGGAPHFESVDERSREFRAARFEAVWTEDPEARAKLGNVYNDWGEDRRASKEYKRAAQAEPELAESADFVASWSEANRRAGRLEKAEEQAKLALELDSSSPRANVARGNVYRSLAAEAREAGDQAREETYLNLSVEAYRFASETSDPGRIDKAPLLRSVAETNLAEAHTALARSALDKGQTEVADRQLEEARKAVAAAETVYPKSENPFLYLAEGQVQQVRARLAKAQGDEQASRQELDKAQKTYQAALERYGDLAPAHYRIGTVYEDKGEVDRAEREYEKAVETQPTHIPTYQKLGRIKEIKDPGSGSVYIGRDRKLVPRKDLVLQPVNTRPVPDLAGMALREAEQAIVESGFTLGEVGRQPSRGRLGSVVGQNPEAGGRAVPGTRIDLTLALPAGSFAMPDLRGLDLEEARRRLIELGLGPLSVRRIEKRSRSRSEVTGQSPRARSQVSVGRAVEIELTVPKPVKVPGVVGKSLRDAVDKLEREGFVAGEVRREASCGSAGQVLGQTPEKGQRATPGSPVALVVSAPAADARPVPGVVGVDRVEAKELLARAGFRLGQVGERESERPPGTVLAQQPAARMALGAGCPVAITVAKPLALVRVPDLAGESLEELQSAAVRVALALAGIELGRVTYIESRQFADGTVVRQSPRVDSQVRRGSRVDLVVARRPAAPPPRPTPTPTTVVPNLECWQPEKAIARLREMGLRHKTSGEGKHVIRQSPAAGSKVSAGTVVTLHIHYCPQ